MRSLLNLVGFTASDSLRGSLGSFNNLNYIRDLVQCLVTIGGQHRRGRIGRPVNAALEWRRNFLWRRFRKGEGVARRA